MYIVATDEVAFNFQLSAAQKINPTISEMDLQTDGGLHTTEQISRGVDHFNFSNLQTLYNDKSKK